MSILSEEGCLDTYTKKLNNRELFNLLQAKRGLKRHELSEFTAEQILKFAIEKHQGKLEVSWSGGRCSTVVLHMALQEDPEIKVLFCNTLVEFPENVKYVREITKKWNLNLTETKPKISFWKLCEKYGLPKPRALGANLPGTKRRIPICCNELKHKPRNEYYATHNITGSLCGLRAAESRVRAIFLGQRGQIYTTKKPQITVYQPIAFWTTEQIRTYLQENSVPANPIYQTQNRNGCWSCTAYITWQRNIQRYNPKLFRFIRDKYWVEPDGVNQTTLSSV